MAPRRTGTADLQPRKPSAHLMILVVLAFVGASVAAVIQDDLDTAALFVQPKSPGASGTFPYWNLENLENLENSKRSPEREGALTTRGRRGARISMTRLLSLIRNDHNMPIQARKSMLMAMLRAAKNDN